ncbi:hypothetical protein AgCh_036663 [Apium graveolens]
MRHDVGLISAFLDRWRPETHTFHLHFGEATVTLEDVYYILGLRSVGRPVLPIGGDVGASLLHELLGVALDPELDMDVIKKGEIKISWLVWIYEHCTTLAPMQRNVYLMQHPRALRWMVPLNTTTVQTRSLRGIRYDLDTMSEDSFRWRPYEDCADEARDIPALELSLMTLSHSKTPLPALATGNPQHGRDHQVADFHLSGYERVMKEKCGAFKEQGSKQGESRHSSQIIKGSKQIFQNGKKQYFTIWNQFYDQQI